MKTAGGRAEISQEALAQAADWFVDFRVGDGDAAIREGFNAWLRQSPQNVQAYLEIARTYAELPAINPSGEVDAEALIAYARSEANVVPLPTVAAAVGSSVAAAPSQKARKGSGMALAASVLLAVVGAISWTQLRGDSYSTDIGERRSITLADGSTIDLNARTRIRVRMTDEGRLVQLLEGQALFKVAKDKTRPFIVRSDDTQVRAVGTQFDVYRRQSGTTVTVLEGRVAVVPVGSNSHSAPKLMAEPAAKVDAVSRETRIAGAEAERRAAREEQVLFLGAGQQTTITPERASAPVHANVAAAVAWTDRMIVFEASPLSQVAEEFNRYTRRQLVIGDPRLESFHISGVYSSTDPASLVRFLRAQQGIQIVETDTEIRILAR